MFNPGERGRGFNPHRVKSKTSKLTFSTSPYISAFGIKSKDWAVLSHGIVISYPTLQSVVYYKAEFMCIPH